MERLSGPHAASAIELVERLDAERRGRPFLVLRDDQGTLVVASALQAAAEALSGIRRYLDRGAGEPGQMIPIIEFIDELTSMLLPLVARRQVAR